MKITHLVLLSLLTPVAPLFCAATVIRDQPPHSEREKATKEKRAGADTTVVIPITPRPLARVVPDTHSYDQHSARSEITFHARPLDITAGPDAHTYLETTVNDTGIHMFLRTISTRELIGAVDSIILKHGCVILNISVEKKYRGQGYGKFLFRQARDYLIRQGCTSIKLTAVPPEDTTQSAKERKNTAERLVRFYQGLGAYVVHYFDDGTAMMQYDATAGNCCVAL
ncbi:MAG TPA: GNAT family N-acetyltransferase [Candidatus Limnocylindria bacterium]|nr:GNAT family N-acetyltransferase [Candidatus Limnocylindria bacterium]